LSETPIEDYTPPPSVGEHTDEILAGIGYDAAAIERLRAARVI
jgi:crotonobetainyl-CoA:carnitine CoA-transferase CaiB-like acyl-CoA transferase